MIGFPSDVDNEGQRALRVIGAQPEKGKTVVVTNTPEIEQLALRYRIEREQDVKRVHRLEKLGCGRFAYLIETPFMTFPKFAVGTTNAANDDVRIVSTCGALTTAEEAYEAVCRPGGADEAQNDG